VISTRYDGCSGHEKEPGILGLNFVFLDFERF
jgi:hypothetical protein